MDALSPPVLGATAAVIVAVATFGGLGGAILLVPVLVVTGIDPSAAVPLGLLSVAAGSLAAAAPQIESGSVNHRVGVVLEVAASAGAIGGAAMSGSVPAGVLRWVLAGAAASAAVTSTLRRGALEGSAPKEAAAAAFGPGELPGRLAGVVGGPGGARTYEAVNVGAGAGLMAVVGVVAGLSGTSGGYLKTPVLQHVLGLPAKAAAATTTFTAGITAAAALGVVAVQGRIAPTPAGAVIAGALVGGYVGSSAQRRTSGRAVRVLLAGVLLGVSVVMVLS